MPPGAYHIDHNGMLTFLQRALADRIDVQAIEWLDAKRTQISGTKRPSGFFMAFSAVPRFVGKADLPWSSEELERAETLRKSWTPQHWSSDQVARALLLLSLPVEDRELYLKTLNQLFQAADVAELCEANSFPGLEALDDRARDLWEPFLSITLLADAEAEGVGEVADFTKKLTGLARDLSGVRDEGDTTLVRLIEALWEIRDGEGRETFTPTALLKLLKAQDGFDWLRSPRTLASLLNPLGILARSNKIVAQGERKTVRQYHLDSNTLDDLRCRYGSPSEEAQEEA